MTLYDDQPFDPLQPESPQPDSSQPAAPEPAPAEPAAITLSGDPISYAAATPAYAARPALPEDLRISWSWPHLLLFLFSVLVSLLAVNIVVLAYLAPKHLTPTQIQQAAESDPQITIGSSLFIFAFVMLFLYVTLSVLRNASFWRSLGWRKLAPNPGAPSRPWIYLLAGFGLSIFVALVGSQFKMSGNAPIQELLTSRKGAILLMATAVLVAPLVEETIFRGYLYPTFVRIFSSVAESFGVESSVARRRAVAISILLTGTLFGLLHGAQLGWTFGFVSLLIFVGVVFTFVRAWTGTVLASFLLHLAYNSTIAITTIIGTHGFTKIPSP